MMKSPLFILTLALASLVWLTPAQAHQPRYFPPGELIVIKNPGVSQAFYGELQGKPDYYLIDLKTEQELYFQILLPDLPASQKDKVLTISYAQALELKPVEFLSLDSASSTWSIFNEEYAGDRYLAGPAGRKNAAAGYYFLKVFSPANAGKYVLVVGDQEKFPPWEMAKAAITIPRLKTEFFNKQLWQVFEGKAGRYVGFGLAALLILALLFRKFHREFR